MNKIKEWFKYKKIQIKLASKGLTPKVFILWVLVWCPVFLIYKLTGLFIYLHDYSAEIANKIDDYLHDNLKKEDPKQIEVIQ